MIDILLASYNGEKYIAEQIESLLAQDYTDFTIKICDDCSTDRTVDIIRHYAKRYPNKVKFTVNEKNSGSPSNNFFALMYSSNADYIMFCDQDDVWFDNKVSASLNKMKEREQELGKDVPLLLHTDLTVTDSGLKPVAKSMFAMQKLDYTRTAVNKLAVQNIATGCTMMLNRALAERLTKAPVSVPVHDWWIALYTACCGKIIFLNEPTLYYRRHNTNVCGAQDMSDMGYIISRAAQAGRARLMIKYGYRQAAEMARLYGESLGKENYGLLSAYGALEGQKYFKRLAFVLKNGTLKSGIVRKTGQFIYL